MPGPLNPDSDTDDTPPVEEANLDSMNAKLDAIIATQAAQQLLLETIDANTSV